MPSWCRRFCDPRSSAVPQRTPEIGVRVALGARTGDVLRLIVGQGMTLALLGVSTGMLGALGMPRFLQTMLHEVSATDPLTFSLVVLTLTAVAFCACWLPARRAAKVDPIIALRYE